MDVRFDATGAAPIAFRFTPQGKGGDWRIDDVYVDPVRLPLSQPRHGRPATPGCRRAPGRPARRAPRGARTPRQAFPFGP